MKQHHEGQPLEHPQPRTPLVPMLFVYLGHLQLHQPQLVKPIRQTLGKLGP